MIWGKKESEYAKKKAIFAEELLKKEFDKG